MGQTSGAETIRGPTMRINRIDPIWLVILSFAAIGGFLEVIGLVTVINWLRS